MKKFLKILSTAVLSIVIGLSINTNVYAASQNYEVTILFTHDLHSHLLPSVNENGGEYGGYARLMTVIEQQRKKYPDATVLVDGGDFSMGSLFQTAYSTSAIELRMMGAMGYDVTTFGNHEFDYLPQGLVSMLNIASGCGEYVPQIVDANYLPDVKTTLIDAAEYQNTLDHYGVKDYTVIERGGVYFVVFGITGFDSDECAPNSGMILADPAETAQKTVDESRAFCIEQYGVEPVVICLSHSGTENSEGEDYELAKAVNGIDVIISAHTHTTLEEPIVVKDTYIVSAGEYGKYLGVVRLDFSSEKPCNLISYELIPIDETVEENSKIAAMAESFKTNVETDYLADYGVTYDEVVVNNSYEFENVKTIKATQHESAVCNVFADAYKWAAEKTTGKTVDMALTAAGVVRESLPTGDITVSDVFNAASLGVGTEGELVSVYITGKELKTAMEIDASVQPLMSAAQLYCSGVEYSFNTNRMIFNKVDYAMLRRDDGILEEIDDEKLYHIVTGMYCGQMLGAVEDTSFGLLSIVPKDIDGNPIAISDLADYVIKDENGVPLKEWYAITSYLQQMGGTMDSRYAQTDGRKVVYSSFNPAKLLGNANVFTYVLLGVIVLLVMIIAAVIRFIIKRKNKKSKI